MSQCESLAGMEKALAMRPIGNLMAVIQLWTISHNDWTLKTEIRKQLLVAAKWDIENPKKLHLLGKK
uniref:Uncharacterized protein n=1 Tax=Panagrolaimus davidi TaxID=227884 RepID=A0A914QC66_9BILA